MRIKGSKRKTGSHRWGSGRATKPAVVPHRERRARTAAARKQNRRTR